MARLQILELPEGAGDDRPPFVLVIDEVPRDEPAFEALRRDLADGDITARTGARAALVFEETINIPANDTTAYLDAIREGPEMMDPELATLVYETLGIEMKPGGIPHGEVLINACRQLQKSEAARAHLRRERDTLAARLQQVQETPTKPDVMNAQQERPDIWLHGYECGVLATRAAARPRNEPTVKPPDA